MEKELISIIVPVYQVREYLNDMIESILAQTYPVWELILVDDGSTDGSGKICDDYAQRDSRIMVIHQKNQGVSAARNCGMSHAKGVYYAFIDADDIVLNDYLETLHKDMIEQGADIVCCNIQEKYQGKYRDYRLVHGKRIIKPEECRERCYGDFFRGKEQYIRLSCSKLIRAELMKNHFFKPIHYGEDTLLMMELIDKSPTVYLDDYSGYIYIRRDTSATMKNGHRYVPNRMETLVSSQYGFNSVADLSLELCCIAADYHANNIHNAAAASVLAGRDCFYSCREDLLEYIENMKPRSMQLSRKSRLRLWLYEYLPMAYRFCVKGLQIMGRTV